MLDQLVAVLFWVVLSAWFGGALFIAVAAQVIFKTVRQYNPILPQVLAVNLEGQHATLLAGTIVGRLIFTLTRIEFVCAAVLAVTLGAQWFLIGPDLHMAQLIRTGLFLGAAGIVLYDGLYLWPRMWRARQEFIDHADEPEKANPAREQFDDHQRLSASLLSIQVFLLLGMVLISASMHSQTVQHFVPVAGG